jgi:hypothetical protein
MSSIPPPSQAGVPSGGNGKYIAVALLLLVGIGGLVIYKVTQSPDVPKPVVVPPPSASTNDLSQSRMDDVPPPPPEDAGGDAAPTRIIIVQGGGGNACDVQACNGVASTELENGINAVARQTRRRCYEKALGNDPTLQGHVTISLKIASTGQVCAATVGNNDMSDTSVASCAANTFLAAHLPSPKGGCVAHLNVPIAYVPAGQH